MVFYESARLLHGRPYALDGEYYASVFVHFTPIGWELVGLSSALDPAALLAALDRYPFGCSEQITSRALPLLYVNDLASAAQPDTGRGYCASRKVPAGLAITSGSKAPELSGMSGKMWRTAR